MMDFEELMVYEKKLLYTPLSCGKHLLELSTYQDIALWWFVDWSFHYSLMRIKKEESQEITSVVGKVIPINVTRFFYRFVVDRIDFVIKYTSFLLYILFRKSLPNRKISDKKKVILFTGEDIEWRPVLDISSGKQKKQDQFFSSLISTLQKKNYVLISTYDVRFPFYKSFSTVVDKLQHWDVLHVPFEMYYTIKIYHEWKLASRHFKKVWAEIEVDPLFQQLLRSAGFKNEDKIRDFIRNYFTNVFPHNLKQISIAKHLIKRINPSVIVIEEETGMFERALLIAARLKGVPTLAIQHGNFNLTHTGYRFKKGQIAEDLSICSPFVQIPDKTAVYGEYHKHLLTDMSAYPSHAVVVTGQPRYDLLISFGEWFSRSRFERKWGISPNKKLILWTTQCHAFPDWENLSYFEAVFNALRIIENVTLIIKQHPGEGERYTQMIHRQVSDYGVDVRVVPKDMDTFEMLFVSDLLITNHSTTGMEAVALNKPVIILNLSGEPDIVNYVEDGVALGVYKKEDLGPVIRKLLADDTELAVHRQEYVRKYLYKIDGKASERVAEVIRVLNRE